MLLASPLCVYSEMEEERRGVECPCFYFSFGTPYRDKNARLPQLYSPPTYQLMIFCGTLWCDEITLLIWMHVNIKLSQDCTFFYAFLLTQATPHSPAIPLNYTRRNT